MMNGITWTAERDEALRVAWSQTSATALDIAKSMGGFDHTADEGRNAVIGRARRLGLARNAKTSELTDTQRAAVIKEQDRLRKRIEKAQAVAAIVMTPASVAVPEEPAIEPERSFNLPFGELRDFSTHRPNQCRFPDPKNEHGPNYLFCGTETLPGESYCDHCGRVCRGNTQFAIALTAEQRETRREQGRKAGYASIRKRGLVMGRKLAAATAPILEAEAMV